MFLGTASGCEKNFPGVGIQSTVNKNTFVESSATIKIFFGYTEYWKFPK